MRNILIGTVGSTRVALEALQRAGHPPVLLLTLEECLGRARHADYVDLSRFVDGATHVAYVDNINEPSVVSRVRDCAPDVIFIIGWSQLVSHELLSAARQCAVGFHPTALPNLRGRSALGWTILLGLEETGATLFVIDSEMDHGPILAQVRFQLDARECIATLISKLDSALAEMLEDIIPRLADGSARPEPQAQMGVSYGARRTSADGCIDWSSPMHNIDRLIRASSKPYAGAFTFTKTRRIAISRAEPASVSEVHYAAAGQIVMYADNCPVVRCGDGKYLKILEYTDGEDGRPLRGQVRFRNSTNAASEER